MSSIADSVGIPDMINTKHIAQNHISDMLRQSFLPLVGKQAVAKNKRKGGRIRDIEEGQSADLPVQFERIDAFAENTLLLTTSKHVFQRFDRRTVQLPDRFGGLHVPTVMNILDHDHADESGMAAMVIEGETTELIQRSQRLHTIKLQVAFAATHPGISFFKHLLVEPLLIAVIIVNHALGRARPRRDFVDTRPDRPFCENSSMATERMSRRTPSGSRFVCRVALVLFEFAAFVIVHPSALSPSQTEAVIINQSVHNTGKEGNMVISGTEQQKLPMRTSIATVSISGEFPEKLSAIAKAGFAGVEIFENDFLTYDASPREVREMVRDHGLEITLFQPFRDFEGMPDHHRQRAFERAERKFDIMGELGTDLMLICSNVSQISLGGVDRAAADFHELGERAAKHGLRVGYEALAWGRHISDHRDAWEVVRRADHKNVGIILDSFHTLSRKIDPNSIRSIPGDKIFIVQLADAPLFDMDLLYWSRHFRNMPGEGDLPVVEFMRAVAATGYCGPLSLEIFNDQFRGGSARLLAEDGHRSLINLMDQVKRQEPDIRIGVPEMPNPVETTGVEFVEFTTGQTEKTGLEKLLTTLGFNKSARHCNREVELYTQGDIRIVINTDSTGDSFAGVSYSVHGTNAYAFGLKVEDANAAMERAAALGAPTFFEPRKSGEASIPAIQGVAMVSSISLMTPRPYLRSGKTNSCLLPPMHL